MPREKHSWGPGEGRTGVLTGRPVNWDGGTPRSAVDGRGGDEGVSLGLARSHVPSTVCRGPWWRRLAARTKVDPSRMQVALLGLGRLKGWGHQERQRRGEEGRGGVPWGLGMGSPAETEAGLDRASGSLLPVDPRKCSGLGASDPVPFLPSLSALGGVSSVSPAVMGHAYKPPPPRFPASDDRSLMLS